MTTVKNPFWPISLLIFDEYASLFASKEQKMVSQRLSSATAPNLGETPRERRLLGFFKRCGFFFSDCLHTQAYAPLAIELQHFHNDSIAF